METNMTQKHQTLYNTLLMVETKGENTKIMAECLRFLEVLIREDKTEKVRGTNPSVVE